MFCNKINVVPGLGKKQFNVNATFITKVFIYDHQKKGIYRVIPFSQ